MMKLTHITEFNVCLFRRLQNAEQIITDPALLLCDEPTSGLDSFMALSIIECLRNYAQKGKTVVCTIHQPSSELYEMFDSLCLLAEGRLAFIGSLPQAAEFFKRYHAINIFEQKIKNRVSFGLKFDISLE